MHKGVKRLSVYNIADFTVGISHDDQTFDLTKLLPSFRVFETTEQKQPLLFSLSIEASIPTATDGIMIRNFDTGNGCTLVHRLNNGGYQYKISDTAGRECCLLQTDKDFSLCRCQLKGTAPMQAFGLNNALMLAFAFAGSRKSALLIHASCVRNGNKAYPFIAKSGTGKSTHSNLWLTHIPGTDLMNDDNPIIRIVDGKTILYGSPWSGKTPCYRNIKAPVGAITRIERAKNNSIEKLTPTKAFASLLPACSSMKWDSDIYNNICNTITTIIETTPVYTLHCLPDKAAAVLCHDTLTK